MENNKNFTNVRINKLLKLIDSCNKTIEMQINAGKAENSLGIRQDKYQRQIFINELNEILKEYKLSKVEIID